MKKIFLCMLCIGGFAFGQQDNPFKINFDVSKYRGDDTHTYVEIYYSFDVSHLHYVPQGETRMGEAVVKALIRRSSDDSIAGYQAWRIPFSVTDTSILNISRSYTDVFGFMLSPDVYRVFLTADDVNDPGVRDSITFVLEVNAFPKGKLMLSDPEICSSIVEAERDSTNRFYKNTYDVHPNPSKIYGPKQPLMYYYLEAYGLMSIPADKYFIKTVVTNAVGKEVVNQEKTRKKIYDSNVEVGLVKIHDLRTGAYTFTYTIFDSTSSAGYSASKRFFVYNPSLPMDTLVPGGRGNIDASVFATMTESEIDKEIQYIRYIETRQEKDRFEAIKGLDAKRRALYEFWESRDKEKSTPENEARQEFLQRVDYANQQFRAGYKEGWKTDRGRVYIIYGPYDEIERHANSGDMKPYEIWFYHSIQGGVEFDFGDKSGFSDYILLNSTHRNEIQDSNWQNQLMQN